MTDITQNVLIFSCHVGAKLATKAMIKVAKINRPIIPSVPYSFALIIPQIIIGLYISQTTNEASLLRKFLLFWCECLVIWG